jgi:hypothetical protein
MGMAVAISNEIAVIIDMVVFYFLLDPNHHQIPNPANNRTPITNPQGPN